LKTILEILKKGTLKIEGQLIVGTNYTFLTSVDFDHNHIQAVYKPEKGEIPLWDFPAHTLANRETAAYIISEALNWNFVPPTIIRSDAPLGRGSLQFFIPHDPRLNYFTFSDDIKHSLKKVVAFDLVVNNADRKGSHIILDQKGQIKLIDHGICFHQDPKYRTVIWDFIGESIPTLLIKDIARLGRLVKTESPEIKDLDDLLSKKEISALVARINQILKDPFFPGPNKNYRPFPYPLV
jgi:uncharacterized repeat protein (TIGR03843 family)